VKVRISNLPSGVNEEDIRGLLEDSDDIRGIELVTEGEAEKPVAVVDMESDAAAEGAVRLLNGRKWKDADLRVDKILY